MKTMIATMFGIMMMVSGDVGAAGGKAGPSAKLSKPAPGIDTGDFSGGGTGPMFGCTPLPYGYEVCQDSGCYPPTKPSSLPSGQLQCSDCTHIRWSGVLLKTFNCRYWTMPSGV